MIMCRYASYSLAAFLIWGCQTIASVSQHNHHAEGPHPSDIGNAQQIKRDLDAFETRMAALKAQDILDSHNLLDKEWIKRKLSQMVQLDQYMRAYPQGIKARAQSFQYLEEFLAEFLKNV